MLRLLWLLADLRNFTATNILLGGDPCLNKTKYLDIETTFWDGSKPWRDRQRGVTKHWYAPEDTNTDLGKTCCVHENKPPGLCKCTDGSEAPIVMCRNEEAGYKDFEICQGGSLAPLSSPPPPTPRHSPRP